MSRKIDKDVFAGLKLDTLAVRAGQTRSHEGEHSEPIYTTSSYVFDSAEDAAKRFSGEAEGNVYSRYTNPTVRMFEQRLAALEGAEAAVGTSSGMAAILATAMAFLQSGDEVVCSQSVFGTTTALFTRYMKKFGVKTTFVELADLSAWKAAVTDRTKLLFMETPSNPTNDVVSIKAIADIAHSVDALLAVDNCFSTPALQQPLAHGADLVVHSATKFLDGQGRVVGGAVCGQQSLIDELVVYVRTCGPTMSAFNAWVFLKGLETLRLRMKAHSDNAMTLAKWLEAQPLVERVNYCGLPSHSSHEAAKSQMSGFGAVLSFEVKGGQAAAWAFIDATQVCSLTANLGDAKTTIVHPATTTHGRITQQERDAAGISDALIRICVGLEDADDLIDDMARGLKAVSELHGS